MSENPTLKRKIADPYYSPDDFDDSDDSDDSDDTITVENKQSTAHRRYSIISRHHRSGGVLMKFSMKVANHILQKNLENMVISPLSMDIALNIIALGSTGDTLKQLLHGIGCNDVEEFNASVSILRDVLRGSKSDDDGPEICFANSLWVDQRYPLKKQFQEIVRDLHKAEVMSVDFKNQPDEVVKEANLWAEKQSKGLIKEILSPESFKKETVMLLANALYFKGTWVERFKPENTKDRDFYLLNGEKVQLPFMSMYGTEFEYGTIEGCQVLRMLYNEGEFSNGEKARNFSMYIVLPEEKDGLPNLLGKIEKDPTMFLDNIELDYEEIFKLAIPKFKFDCKLSLKETMVELGLTLPFDETTEDITEMVESENSLVVTEIFQKSCVEVNEEGTKAVTFTVVEMAETCGLPETKFVADHPFMFLIREDYSGAILYVGTVLNP